MLANFVHARLFWTSYSSHKSCSRHSAQSILGATGVSSSYNRASATVLRMSRRARRAPDTWCGAGFDFSGGRGISWDLEALLEWFLGAGCSFNLFRCLGFLGQLGNGFVAGTTAHSQVHLARIIRLMGRWVNGLMGWGLPSSLGQNDWVNGLKGWGGVSKHAL